jgi:hypothetical protein
MLPQGPQGGLQGPIYVVQGGTFKVDVGPNDTFIEIKEGLNGPVTRIPATPGKSVVLPVPEMPGGSYFIVRVGNKRRSRGRIFEIIAPSP